MKKNKGFTLIELLAVIVILAVIALIATPIIMNVISDSKNGAAKDAMYGYVKAVELATAKSVTATTDAPTGTYIVKDGNLVRGTDILNVSFKGTSPSNDGTVTLANGTVASARLNFNHIEVSYLDKKAELGNVYSAGEEIYLDPTGTVADCKAGKEWTPESAETICYKWNVIKDNGNSLELLLDHNINPRIAWNSSNDTSNGPVEVYNQLKIDTTSWSKVETLTNSDNVTRDNAIDGTYMIQYAGMKARLISAKEVADIAQNTSWNVKGNAISIALKQWLYQNISEENLAIQAACYWTDTASSQHITSAWRINWDKRLDYMYANNNLRCGIRPVVRVLKSSI